MLKRCTVIIIVFYSAKSMQRSPIRNDIPSYHPPSEAGVLKRLCGARRADGRWLCSRSFWQSELFCIIFQLADIFSQKWQTKFDLFKLLMNGCSSSPRCILYGIPDKSEFKATASGSVEGEGNSPLPGGGGGWINSLLKVRKTLSLGYSNGLCPPGLV